MAKSKRSKTTEASPVVAPMNGGTSVQTEASTALVEKPKRLPPMAWKPGQSGNPKGRPRSGTALAERIREHLDPDIIIELAKKVARDKKLSPGLRLAALLPVFDRGYVRPPLHVEASQNVAITVGLEIDRVVSVLDEEGLRCLEVVMAQLERAGIQALPSAQDTSLPGGVIDAESIEHE